MRAVWGAVVTVITFILMDAVAVTFVMSKLYLARVASHLRERLKVSSAIGFYVCQSLALVVLASLPSVGGPWQEALGRGAVLGAATYGAWAFTAYAVLRDWPVDVVFVDVIYGTVVCAVAVLLGWMV